MDSEAERFWLSCDTPLELLKALHPTRTLGSVQPQSRQSRLDLVACARRRWESLPRSCRVLVALDFYYNSLLFAHRSPPPSVAT